MYEELGGKALECIKVSVHSATWSEVSRMKNALTSHQAKKKLATGLAIGPSHPFQISEQTRSKLQIGPFLSFKGTS